MKKKMGQVLVVGSLNMDLLIQSPRLPKPGETLLGCRYASKHGGKGANQAYAAAMLGSSVAMLGCVGDDRFGSSLIGKLQEAGVDTGFIGAQHEKTTGTAFVMTDSEGNNSIIVIPGANELCTAEYVHRNRELFQQADCVLLQLEIPIDGVIEGVRLAKEYGKRVILNPAPARSDIPADILCMVDVLTPNETELALLTGIDTDTTEKIEHAARILLEKGVGSVVVTLGEAGAMLVTAERTCLFPARRVKAIDSTGAGDCFNGVIAALLAVGTELEEAIRVANAAASISTTREGAMCSMPSQKEIETARRESGNCGEERERYGADYT